MRLMPLAASLPSMSAVSSVLQSSSTSPVSVSTMSRASERPTMYSGGTCSVSSFAFSIRRMWRAVMRRPRSTITAALLVADVEGGDFTAHAVGHELEHPVAARRRR